MLYVLIGFLSGIISGMGIGGGAILIPALVIFYNMPQQSAQAVNLIYFIPTAIIALIIHIKKGNIEKGIGLKIILAGIVSVIIGSFIAINIDDSILKKIFGGFLLIMGISEFFKKD